MNSEKAPLTVLLVTANVGSMFEQAGALRENWLCQLYKLISDRKPDVVALHCQEIGGKSIEQSVDLVDDFVETLMATDALKQFNRMRSFVDKAYTKQEEFTALGSFYFIHEDIEDVAMWDFIGNRFHPIEGRVACDARSYSSVCGGKKFHWKVKFSPELFPMFPISRKGFIRTRWRLNGRIFDLVNLHLFHDASNLQASEQSPSKFAHYRQRALMYTLERLADAFDTSPVFLFGDFNFRLDLQQFLQAHYADHRCEPKRASDGSLVRSTYYQPLTDKVALIVERKLFQLFNSPDFSQEFDREMDDFPSLYELPVKFQPSYPFQEEDGACLAYMPTRCPAWCDRILFNRKSHHMLTEAEDVSYDLIAEDVCMGDHKPVALSFVLPHNAFRQANCEVVKALRRNSTLYLDLSDRCSWYRRKLLPALLVGMCIALPFKAALGLRWHTVGALAASTTAMILAIRQ